ncbi:MAG: ribosomal protein [Verrucomicrobiales bacterium]|nr:ribosomal protein [Verrucomicrobiales bacterium]
MILGSGSWILDTIMSYRNLEIWQLARVLAVDIHKMSLTQLPKHELYEEGSQIRRSAHSIRSNIVEGYGRRRYKQEFLKHLTYALGSCDETSDHLLALFETGSLRDQELFQSHSERVELLGKKLNSFTQGVEREHNASGRPINSEFQRGRSQ